MAPEDDEPFVVNTPMVGEVSAIGVYDPATKRLDLGGGVVIRWSDELAQDGQLHLG